MFSLGRAAYLKSKCRQLEDELQGEDRGEDHVKNVQRFRVDFRLPIKLHRQCDGVDHDQSENSILERLGSDEPPDFVLYSMLRYVAPHRFRL